MSGMFEKPSIPAFEANELQAFFSSPPNPFSGEAPSTESLVDAVFTQSALMDLPKTMPFEVPEAYTQSAIEMPKKTHRTLLKTLTPFLQAACILLMIGLGFLPLQQPRNNTLDGVNNIVLNADDARWYLENNVVITDIDWYEYEEQMVNNDRIVFQTQQDLLSDLTPEEVNNFF
jgi:hypothetical protein